MKRFLIAIVSPLKSPLLLLSIALVYFLHISEDITGDIGKLGQIIFSKEYHFQEKFQTDDVDRIPWSTIKDLRNQNVLFLGDSFTKGLIYPDYLSLILHQNAAKFFADNIETPEKTFVALCNAGVEMPDVVVIESVEREFPFRLCHLDFSLKIDPIPSVYKPTIAKQSGFSTFYKNKMINNHAIFHVTMQDSLFTCPCKEKDLYFYHDDLRFPDDEQIWTAISKLDSLFLLAKEKNVCLFYVVAADKYDVYQEFTICNKYPKKELLERFVDFETNPYYVNTKHVLLKNARQGVKDLYYADDTHWSPIGAKIVAEEIARRMDSLGVFQN